MIRRALLVSTLLASPALALSPSRASAAVVAPAPALHVTMRPDGMDVRTGQRLMRVTALAAGALRVRVGLDGALGEDASWAVPEAVRQATATVKPLLNGFSTGELSATVDAAGRLTVRDAAGHMLSQDAEPVEQRHNGFALAKVMPQNDRYYGLGDKTGPLDRRGLAYTMWNTDAGFQETTDPIYKSIPFFIEVAPDGRASGLFLDNTWRSLFDFGKTERDTLRFGAEGGPIDYYVIAGPTAEGRGRALRQAHRPVAAAAALDAGLPAVALQLHVRRRGARHRRRATARSRSRSTPSISTSTIRTATGPSPSTPRPSPTCRPCRAT